MRQRLHGLENFADSWLENLGFHWFYPCHAQGMPFARSRLSFQFRRFSMNDRTQTLLQDSDAFDDAAAVDRVHAAVSQAADALGELDDQWLGSARAHIREQPLTAIAIGLLAGVLLSRLAR
jgi:ElaB/YqjD/DUF883 family membrane-anchored ribosome-binding protein